MPELGSLVELAIGIVTGGGLLEAIRAIARRRKTHAEAVKTSAETTITLSDSTLGWAQVLKQEADEARAGETAAWNELRRTRLEVRTEMDALASELHKHRQLAEVLTYRYRVLVGAIMGPNASIEDLRRLVSDPSFSGHQNGTGG